MLESHRTFAAGVDTHFYDEGSGTVPVVCVHGNLDSGDAWQPLLAQSVRLGRVIAPDLPGFGRSGRGFAATFDAYVNWFDAFLDALAIERFRLVAHDFGSLALAAAARRPQDLAALVAIDVVPLSAAYRWHWIARLLWRPPVIAEVAMTVFNRPTIKLLTRLQRPNLKPLDAGYLDRIERDLDSGTKRAILHLYRSADPAVLGRYGAALPRVRCPALLIWGDADPYVGVHEMDALAAALSGPTETRIVAGGHWPMLDTEAVFAETAAFLAQGATA